MKIKKLVKIYFFFFFIVSLSLSALPPMAPLIPMTPKYPLGFSESNRQLLIEGAEQLQKNEFNIRTLIEQHSFPWVTSIFLLILGSIGWLLFLTQNIWLSHLKMKFFSAIKQKNLNEVVEKLNNESIAKEPSQQYFSHLSAVLVDALEMKGRCKISTLTTSQINRFMQKHPFIPAEEIENAIRLLSEIDQIKFGGTTPSLKKTEEISIRVQNFFNHLSK